MGRKRGFDSLNSGVFSQSKKGLSEVIATLMIILLVLVAVGIIWVVIRNVIGGGAEEIELSSVRIYLSIEDARVELESSIPVIKVTVSRDSREGELTGVRFIFSDNENSYSVDRKTPITVLGRKTFRFNSAEVEVSDVTSMKKVSVAPIYEVSGREKIGDITDTADIGRDCGDGNCDVGENAINCPIDCGGGGGGAFCGDGACGAGEDAASCPADCAGATPASCDGTWNQTDIDDGNECDGTPLPNGCETTCICKQGFTLNGAGGCTLNPPINSGVIFSVWPQGAIKYFDSEDLPVQVTSFIGEYVNFSNSAENGCFRITFAEYLELNGRSYLRTDFVVNINANENYHVWQAINCGL